MKLVIRLGDPTSHGGTVVSATSHLEMFGKQVARLGDKVTCPIPGHGVCTIAEGDPLWSIDGIPVALEGHKTTCGASLISTLPNVQRSYEGMGRASTGGGMASGVAAGASTATSIAASEAADPSQASEYDEQAHLNVAGNTVLAGLPYYIETSDGRKFTGRADERGLLPRIDTPDEEEYIVYWGDEALARMEEGR